MRKYLLLLIGVSIFWIHADGQTRAELQTQAEAQTQAEVQTQAEAQTQVEFQNQAEVQTRAEAQTQVEFQNQAEFQTQADVAGVAPVVSDEIAPNPETGIAEAHAAKDSADLDTLANSLLWEINIDGMSTSYLFGTIHLIPGEDYFLPEGTEQAFELSERIVFEIDMNEMTDISAQLGLLMRAMMPDGKRLRDLVSAEDYELVKAHFDKMGLPLMMLERIKPMFLSVFASGDISMDDFSSGSTKSYEMEFFEMAQVQEKEVGGLETMAFQIAVFDSIPYEVQAEMLVEAIRDQDDESSQFQEMIDMYKSQNVDALSNMLTSGDEDLGGYEDILVTDRNKNWIGLMGPMMHELPVFFAVGAGHLGGYDGVIRLLRRAGYEVTPVLAGAEGTSRPKKRF